MQSLLHTNLQCAKNCNWKHYSAFNFWSSIILKNVKKPNYLTIQRQHIHFAYGTWENNTHKQTYIKYVILISCILNVRFTFISLLSYYTTTTVTTLRPLYTSTCVSRHLQWRTGKFCWYTTPKIMRDIEHQSRPGFFSSPWTKPPAASSVAGSLLNSESGFDIMTRCWRQGNAQPRRCTSDHWVMQFELKKKWVTDGNVRSTGSSMLVYSLKLRCSSYSLLKSANQSVFSHLCMLKMWHYPHLLLQCQPCSGWSIFPIGRVHSSKPTA